MKTLRISAITVLTLLTAALLTACTVNVGTSDMKSDSGMTMDHGMMGHDMTGESSSDFSGEDIMFAQMMIPHHQQAVDMGTLAETRASDTEVKALAAKIKAEQSPEIAQMKTWLSSANAPMEMGHDMGMDGMLDADQIETLANSKGAAFDKLFLEAMIAHHKGAIQMAEMVISSNNVEAAALGKAIIESQTEEISFMESLLAK